MSDIADYYDLDRIRPEVQAKLRLVNEMGRDKFAARARAVDDEASFPVENYKDLAAEGFLGLCIPE
jgi:alkylation response protein AidB-like acyl-CoA dehydrogenase